MNKNQLQKIINDYRNQRCAINFNLSMLEQQRKALVSRRKLISRKINILTDKYENSKEDTINWSSNDFDDLDIIM